MARYPTAPAAGRGPPRGPPARPAPVANRPPGQPAQPHAPIPPLSLTPAARAAASKAPSDSQLIDHFFRDHDKKKGSESDSH